MGKSSLPRYTVAEQGAVTPRPPLRVAHNPGSGPVKKRNSSVPKTKRAQLKPLPPNAPAARDEGPRLLPLTPGKDQTGLEHFLRLADVALGRKKRDRDRLP